MMEGEKLVGIVSIGDVIHSMPNEVEFENKVPKGLCGWFLSGTDHLETSQGSLGMKKT